MYCWECEDWVPCKVPENPTSDIYVWRRSPEQRGTLGKYPDIWWFERLRLCPEEHEVKTVEVDERLLDEVIRLRDLVELLAPASSALSRESKTLVKKIKGRNRNTNA